MYALWDLLACHPSIQFVALTINRKPSALVRFKKIWATKKMSQLECKIHTGIRWHRLWDRLRAEDHAPPVSLSQSPTMSVLPPVRRDRVIAQLPQVPLRGPVSKAPSLPCLARPLHPTWCVVFGMRCLVLPVQTCWVVSSSYTGDSVGAWSPPPQVSWHSEPLYRLWGGCTATKHSPPHT